jgi:1-acyl-sn-glycerol-3-phosphate acyltransferase
LPRSDLPGWRRTLRYVLSRLLVGAGVRLAARLRVEGRDRLPTGAAIYCFNHLNWSDPFVLMAALPLRPRLYFFGPKEEDMAAGSRNRMMLWTGSAVPFKPGKNDLLETTRRVGAVIETGGVLAIAGEGRIHVHEADLLPIQEGAAYFALRSGIPIVPIAINGTSWLAFRRTIHVRIGTPLVAAGRPNRESVDSLTAATWAGLHLLLEAAPEQPVPGRFWRWLTEAFNDWPEGSRTAAALVRGPSGILPDDARAE